MQKVCDGLPNLSYLGTNKQIGILLSPDGYLHIYLDGRHSKAIAANLPVHKRLWGAVDVCGNCTKIKSEILSGELN